MQRSECWTSVAQNPFNPLGLFFLLTQGFVQRFKRLTSILGVPTVHGFFFELAFFPRIVCSYRWMAPSKTHKRLMAFIISVHTPKVKATNPPTLSRSPEALRLGD